MYRQTGIVVVAGKWCVFWHPNQTKRHYERAAEGQVASLKNQAAAQLQKTTQQKKILFSQIQALSIQSRQEIEAEYQASYIAIIEEFAQSQKIHEEALLALSFFWVYGRAIINAEEVAQQQAIKKSNDVELQGTAIDAFNNLILGNQQSQINLNYNQKLIQLAAEKADIINAFSANYKDAVKEETTRFASFVAAHEAALKSLSLDKDTRFAALAEFMNTQIQAVDNQYNADIKAIETAVKKVINEVNGDLQNCLKSLDAHRKSMALNGVLIVGATLVACAVPALLPAAGKLVVGAVQVSAATTGLSAADNLFNGNGAVGVNVTVNVASYTAKPYVSPPYNATPLPNICIKPGH